MHCLLISALVVWLVVAENTTAREIPLPISAASAEAQQKREESEILLEKKAANGKAPNKGKETGEDDAGGIGKNYLLLLALVGILPIIVIGLTNRKQPSRPRLESPPGSFFNAMLTPPTDLSSSLFTSPSPSPRASPLRPTRIAPPPPARLQASPLRPTRSAPPPPGRPRVSPLPRVPLHQGQRSSPRSPFNPLLASTPRDPPRRARRRLFVSPQGIPLNPLSFRGSWDSPPYHRLPGTPRPLRHQRRSSSPRTPRSQRTTSTWLDLPDLTDVVFENESSQTSVRGSWDSLSYLRLPPTSDPFRHQRRSSSPRTPRSQRTPSTWLDLPNLRDVVFENESSQTSVRGSWDSPSFQRLPSTPGSFRHQRLGALSRTPLISRRSSSPRTPRSQRNSSVLGVSNNALNGSVGSLSLNPQAASTPKRSRSKFLGITPLKRKADRLNCTINNRNYNSMQKTHTRHYIGDSLFDASRDYATVNALALNKKNSVRKSSPINNGKEKEEGKEVRFDSKDFELSYAPKFFKYRHHQPVHKLNVKSNRRLKEKMDKRKRRR